MRVRTIRLLVLTAFVASASPGSAHIITQIIGATGDGAGKTLSGAGDIAVNSSGNVYVTGVGSKNVFKITPGGMITEIMGWGELPPELWELMPRPEGLAADGLGNVYVPWCGSDNAVKITPGGVITEIINAAGDGAGNTLSCPAAIAVDGWGNVYVAGGSRSTSSVFKIRPDGVITKIIDETGDRTGHELDHPAAIAVDGSGNVYVAADGHHNAFKITPGGQITQIIDEIGDGVGNTLEDPYGIAVDSSGNCYVAGMSSNNAFKVTPRGVITKIIDLTGDGAGNTLCYPSGIAVDGLGNVYVTGGLCSFDSSGCSLGVDGGVAFKITPGGIITVIIETAGDGTGNEFYYGSGIAVDDSLNVYVAGDDEAFKITGVPWVGTGLTQDDPIVPSGDCDYCDSPAARSVCLVCLDQSRPCFQICDVPTETWIDPPIARGYEYEMTTEGAVFTHILDFPVGFSGPFTVYADGTLVPGSFGPGDSVGFGAGVSKFVVTGITPPVDAMQANSFPIKLAFTDQASFRMRPLGCGATPALTCQEGWQKGSLSVKESKPGSEKVGIKFKAGPELSQSDFGNPLVTDGTEYDTCIYNNAGNLIASLSIVGAGADCGGRECWKSLGDAPPNGEGYFYRDRAMTSDGTQKLKLKAGSLGSSSIQFNARNNARKEQTSLPTGIAQALASATSVTVQLTRSDAAECFSMMLSEIQKQEPDFFRVK
jgi:hypothetical protein